MEASRLIMAQMFPGITPDVLDAILRSERGDLSVAIERLLEMSMVNAGHSGSELYIAEQIAKDAALAMALQSEELQPAGQMDSRAYLAHLQRNAPGASRGRGLEEDREDEDAPMSLALLNSLASRSLLEEAWTFSASFGASQREEDEPLDGDITERVIKGSASTRKEGLRRGPCGTGLRRRHVTRKTLMADD